MNELYERRAQEVMDHLESMGRSRDTVREHGKCLRRLGEHLEEAGLEYSDAVADEWFGQVSAELSKTARSIWAAALGKLSDAYAMREMGTHHRRAPKAEDRLGARHLRLLDDYCSHLRGAGLADATVTNRRQAATRFLLALEARGVGDVADASYDDVIETILALGGVTVRSLLVWLHSAGVLGRGFAMLADAMSLRKGYCWNGVDPGVVARLRDSQSPGDGSLDPDGYLALVEGLGEELRANGYSRNHVHALCHFGRLIYLFMEVNGLRYDAGVAGAWLESMRPSLSYSDYMTCRRALLLLGQSHEGVEHDLSRNFGTRGNALDRLPGWCRPEVEAFLAMKAAEGWRDSTLAMFRTCVCRFCSFADSVGVTGFGQLTAEHVKRFNAEDPHETPEGKNAFNSRVRQFLDWLGSRGVLPNPNLFLALPNVAAPREELVVTLTPDEQLELEGVIYGDDGQSLRDKAMLLLGLRMGVRASDVVGLGFDDVGWGDSTLRFTQAKTGYEVDLPMPAEVGNALYRYIVDERPASADRAVFLRGKAPHTPMSATVAQHTLATALPDRDVEGSGFHVLRRTFASNMLMAGADPHEVAEALGHHGTGNVNRYLHLDAERMRLCAISLEEAGLTPREGGIFDE